MSWPRPELKVKRNIKKNTSHTHPYNESVSSRALKHTHTTAYKFLWNRSHHSTCKQITCNPIPRALSRSHSIPEIEVNKYTGVHTERAEKWKSQQHHQQPSSHTACTFIFLCRWVGLKQFFLHSKIALVCCWDFLKLEWVREQACSTVMSCDFLKRYHSFEIYAWAVVVNWLLFLYFSTLLYCFRCYCCFLWLEIVRCIIQPHAYIHAYHPVAHTHTERV